MAEFPVRTDQNFSSDHAITSYPPVRTAPHVALKNRAKPSRINGRPEFQTGIPDVVLR
jgi:hypothetical protein